MTTIEDKNRKLSNFSKIYKFANKLLIDNQIIEQASYTGKNTVNVLNGLVNTLNTNEIDEEINRFLAQAKSPNILKMSYFVENNLEETTEKLTHYTPDESIELINKIIGHLFGLLIDYYMSNSTNNSRYIIANSLADIEAMSMHDDRLYSVVAEAKLLSFQAMPQTLDNICATIKTNGNKLDKKLTEVNNAFTKLKEDEDSIKELNNQIQKLKSEFNFVGLSNGFKNIHESKTREKNVLKWLLVLFSFIMAAAPWLSYITLEPIKDTPSSISGTVAHIAVFFTTEIILVYVFRVLLHQFNNVKAILLQIEQRLNICQFFESYIDFANKQQNNRERFEKFESLIFSGLLMDQSQLPSTFDGLDNLSKLIGSIKNKP